MRMAVGGGVERGVSVLRTDSKESFRLLRKLKVLDSPLPGDVSQITPMGPVPMHLIRERERRKRKTKCLARLL